MESLNPIVNCGLYRDGFKISNIQMDEVHKALDQQGQFVWIGLNEPETEVVLSMQREFGLHDLAIEDTLKAHQRPKLEEYGNTIFIVLRTAQLHGQQVEVGETHLFLGSNFLITIRHGSSKKYTEVRTRCEGSPHLLKKGPGFALYAVMDSIVDQYFPLVDAVDNQLADLEQRIFHERLRRETTSMIYTLKRQLMELKRSVSPLIDICNRLMRFDLKLIDEETRPYFRDIYDHTVRINEMIDNQRELLSMAMDTNFSLINISQSEVSKRFAGWAALIGVPTMVVGIYGMNFKHMPELDSPYAYPVVMIATFGICAFLYYRFKKSGWL